MIDSKESEHPRFLHKLEISLILCPLKLCDRRLIRVMSVTEIQFHLSRRSPQRASINFESKKPQTTTEPFSKSIETIETSLTTYDTHITVDVCMYDTMPMSEPRRDPTSPAHLISQYINVLAHAVITEPNEQSHKSSDHLLFLRKKVKIQTYGQTYLRMLMAMMVLNIWAVEDTMIRQKSPDDWQRCINDLKTLYKASIRKDASCFFVLDLAADESEYNFKTDGAEFHRLQQKLKDERVDPMVMKKLKHQFSKLTMRLKFIKALSIIRSDLERILGQEDVDVGEEDSEKSVFADASLNLVEQFT